jgi:hypothetical protein
MYQKGAYRDGIPLLANEDNVISNKLPYRKVVAMYIAKLHINLTNLVVEKQKIVANGTCIENLLIGTRDIIQSINRHHVHHHFKILFKI